jgi:gamma-glutamyltranspeptidase/glutathione hydrolase
MRHLFYLTLCLLLCVASPAMAVEDTLEPEAKSEFQQKEAVTSKGYMVAAAHPLATKAGVAVLEKGGSAVDAAIAAQLALTVIEPHSSGIGGGGFMLYHDAETRQTRSFDGREKAPRDASGGMFLNTQGQPNPFKEMVPGGLSVGVPGVLKMLWEAHRLYGELPWSVLFEPAIRLAADGYPMTQRMHDNVSFSPYIRQFKTTHAHYLLPSGEPKPIGTTLKNPELARSLRLIAQGGMQPFYEGELAHAMVKAVQQSPVNPGHLAMSDLIDYQPIERETICMPYRQWNVCSMAPPSSGGLTVLQILGMLAHKDLGSLQPDSAEAIHLLAEASRLAFADRNALIADPDFVEVPIDKMLDAEYLKRRANLIQADNAMESVEPGIVPQREERLLVRAEEPPSTSHISVVDAQGNAVSFTTSIEYAYGSGLMVRGFLLNNQMTDFAFTPKKDGVPVANRVEPLKRPRSSMSPTLVFDNQGQLKMVVGSPGGARIIGYTVQTILNVLDWKMPLQDAVDAPRVIHLGKQLELEEERGLEAQKEALEAMGHTVSLRPLVSGVHAIWVQEDGSLVGAADPRREGAAMGGSR